MSKPWTKNPYLSAWLSGAKATAGKARSQASRTARRQAAAVTRQITETVVDAWLASFSPPAQRRTKRS